MPKRSKEDETLFLNVDLDISSATALQPLVNAFGDDVDVLHVGSHGRQYSAHLEVAGSGHGESADRIVLEFVALIENLPRGAASVWKKARSRVFNVGIQSGIKPRAFELPLCAEAIAAIASVDGSLVITVYAAEKRANSVPDADRNG